MRGEDHVTNTAAADRDIRGAGRGGARLRPFPAAGGRGRRGPVQAAGLAVAGARCARTAWSRWRSRSYLAKIGTSDPVEPRLTLDELAGEFDFAKIGRAPAHFDPEELAALNARTLHIMPYDARWPARVRRWRSVLGSGQAQSDQAQPMRPSWSRLVTGPVTPVIEDAGLAAKAAGAAAARTLGRGHLGRLDQGGRGRNRGQGQGAVSSPAAGPDRAGAWTGTQKTVTPDRARPRLWRGWKEKPRDAQSSSLSGFRFAANARKNPSARPHNLLISPAYRTRYDLP